MIDYFTYNGENTLPQYKPGVPGYGQKGAPGNTGEPGASVHYSSYNLAEINASTMEIANEKINKGLALSNNESLKNDAPINYAPGDIILDAAGHVFSIDSSINGELYILPSAKTIYASTQGVFKNCSVSCKTTFSGKGDLSWKKKLPNASEKPDASLGTYDPMSYSPNVMHRYSHADYIYGNYICFDVTVEDAVSDSFIYKFVLVLPNGEKISTIASNKTSVFIDNKYFYSCAEYCNYYTEIDRTKTLTFDDFIFTSPESGVTKTIRELINYSQIDNNDEGSKYVSYLTSMFIRDYCFAYIEAYAINGKNAYRIDVDDVFIRSKTDTGGSGSSGSPGSIVDRIDYIQEATTKTEFSTVVFNKEYDSIVNPDGQYDNEYVKLDSILQSYFFGKTDEAGNPFEQMNRYYYHVHEPLKSEEDEFKGALDDMIVKGYFIPGNYSRVASAPYARTVQDDACAEAVVRTLTEDDDDIPLFVNDEYSNNIVPLSNKCIRIKFVPADYMVLEIDFENLADNSDPEGEVVIDMPAVGIMVGIPNVPMMIVDTNVAMKYAVNTTEYDPTRSSQAGMYYSKIVYPFGWGPEGEGFEGFKNIYRIDFSEYKDLMNSDALNFIDIAFMSLDNNVSHHSHFTEDAVMYMGPDVIMYVSTFEDLSKEDTAKEPSGEEGEEQAEEEISTANRHVIYVPALN